MPRITQHTGSAGDTLRYYFPPQAEYYSGGPAFEMQWFGAGAARLGLDGAADPEHFRRLLQNRDPVTNTQLSPRTRGDRRKGWDVCFNVPKEVSVAFIDGDTRIVDALRASINDTLAEMERDVLVRLRKGGQNGEQKTGELIAAVVIHPEARAVKGYAPDVNLRGHVFISNHTFADRWYAADISNLYRDAQGYFEAAFQSRLDERMQAIGFATERTEHNFRLSGIPRSLSEKFSKRSAQINEKISSGYADRLAGKLGVSLADAKGMVGALTRDPKKPSYTLSELQRDWRSQLTPDESVLLNSLHKQARLGPASPPERVTAKQAVDYALAHGFEQESVVRERQVLAAALRYGIGDVDVASARAELSGRDLIRQGRDEAALLTTRKLQQEELDILNFAKQGRGSARPLAPDHHINRDWLSDEQQTAVRRLLQSPDRLQLLRGAAGVGKSTLIAEFLDATNAAHIPVAMMAPTQKAAENLAQDGFEASTLQSFLLNEKAQQAVQKGVIVVDEAGLVDSPSFRALTTIAAEQQARIIAVGDDRQHVPVGRGHPTRLLQQAGIEPIEVTRIRRQRGAYRDAVAHLSRGEVAEGFAGLKKLGFVHAEAETQTRNANLAKDYAKAAQRHKQKDLLVIAPTHAERHAINAAVRQELKARRLVGAKDHSITTYLPKQLTVAERQDPILYAPGDLVAFHSRGEGGIRPGDQLAVTQVTRDQVFAGETPLPLRAAKGFSVFRPQESEYSVGDVIRLTRGRRQSPTQGKLANGSLHTISAIQDGVVTLEGGKSLPPDFRFFDHGRVVTSHVSQGSTVKRAFVASSSMSFPASDAAQMYVSSSRAKERVDIYTDNLEGLERAISRVRPKPLATDLQIGATHGDGHPSTDSLGAKANRLRDIAKRFATSTLQRFGRWLQPDRNPEPQLGR